MKKLISRILKHFIERYRLYAWIGEGKKSYLEVKDLDILIPKDAEWYAVTVNFFINKKKETKMDDISIKVEKVERTLKSRE